MSEAAIWDSEWGQHRHLCIRWDGGPRAPMGVFSPIGLNGVFERIFKTEMYLTHA